MISDIDAAVAGMAFLVGVIALLVMGIIIFERRGKRERLEHRRELNQAHAAMDKALGHDLEATRQLVWSHRAKPSRKHKLPR